MHKKKIKISYEDLFIFKDDNWEKLKVAAEKNHPNIQHNGSHKISKIWGKKNHTKSRVDHKIKASAPPSNAEKCFHLMTSSCSLYH